MFVEYDTPPAPLIVKPQRHSCGECGRPIVALRPAQHGGRRTRTTIMICVNAAGTRCPIECSTQREKRYNDEAKEI
jgi:hypothetical protein